MLFALAIPSVLTGESTSKKLVARVFGEIFGAAAKLLVRSHFFWHDFNSTC
jgi:predicted membrane channel-forming protein YqfA (hemolysin III family)